MVSGHTDRDTINQRRPMTAGMRELLEQMAEPGGVYIGCDQGNASRARGLMDRGYAITLGVGQPWVATEAGKAALHA